MIYSLIALLAIVLVVLIGINVRLARHLKEVKALTKSRF